MFSSLLGLKTLVVPLIVCCCLESKGFFPFIFWSRDFFPAGFAIRHAADFTHVLYVRCHRNAGRSGTGMLQNIPRIRVIALFYNTPTPPPAGYNNQKTDLSICSFLLLTALW